MALASSTLFECLHDANSIIHWVTPMKPNRWLLVPLLSISPSLMLGADVSFRGLGHLYEGAADSSANAVSADGLVVVGASRNSSGNEEAFRWTAQTGMIGLGTLPGQTNSVASGISADGTIIVGGGSFRAFRWTESGGMTELSFQPGTGAFAATVSADGAVAAGNVRSAGGAYQQASRWVPALELLGDLPGDDFISAAYGISGDGSVVVGVGTTDQSLYEAFRWEGGVMTGLGHLTGDNSAAFDVSADGSVVVGRTSTFNGYEAFRWTAESGMVGLGDLTFPGGSPLSEAFAVSGDGRVIVGVSREEHAGDTSFIWDAVHGMRNLRDVLRSAGVDLSDWRDLHAHDVSYDGHTIVGWGLHADGLTGEAWLATIPEPESFAAAISGAAWLALSLVFRTYRRIGRGL
jgi:probable HAF family extracellular repeat protein